MDHKAIDLYNEYIHGNMPRRDFLRRLAGVAGGAAAATALLPLLESNYAWGQQVAPDDGQLETATIEYAGAQGPVRGYLAKPAGAAGALPGVLVIHENRGLNAHIEDVARRAALAGYVALAPDGLTYAGGAPQDQEAARDLFGRSDRERITADVIAGVPHLAARTDCTGKVGTVGFCYGGGVALQCAAREAATAAAVCFYGSALTAEEVARVQAPLMLHYAGRDERINQSIPEFRQALDAHGVAYSLHMYPGTDHGFHNDSSQARYNAEAATLAWQRTLAFFRNYL
ncbi:MAG: dienelactone hydrolase family protein [Xanthomonadales bacterium]|jgi:carboxymethylenebutenolidase|nr:dienelactone hydrolase family protein [Xanthomonadales bacterium]